MKKRTHYITALLLSLSLGSIAFTQQPSASFFPESYRDATGSDTGSIAPIPWRQFFANDELAALIDTALKNNTDLQIAIRNIEIANKYYKVARLGLLPDVKLSAGASVLNPSDNSLNGLSAELLLKTHHIQDYTLGLGLSWEADIWGKVKNQKKEALARYLQTQEAHKGIQTSIVSAIANGYYNLLLLDMQLQIARRNVILSDSTLQQIKLQYNAAQVTSLAVQQIEAQKLIAAQLIPGIEQEITIQENALSILSGAAPAAVKRSRSLYEIELPAINSGMPATLLNSRPDVRTAELELAASTARAGYSKANMYPSLIISASGGVNSLMASSWFNLPASLFGIVAGGITQPLFQKKQLRTQYEVAKLKREQDVLRFRQAVLQATGEVADALVTVQKLGQQQETVALRINVLRQATGNAALLFNNGQATYIEVLTAQSNLLTGELQLAALKQAKLSAAVQLYRSLGGGWK